MSNPTPNICDYEGSTYRTDFWEGKGRDYEDAVERIALRALLPHVGRRYADFGGGFGRLVNEADPYDQVALVDYSRTMLKDAQARLGHSDRYLYVAADLYHLPFAANAFDVAICCRVIHHLADAPAALQQIRNSLTPGATFVLEFANKQNLKAMLRYLLRRQSWSPYAREPIEFVKLNFDFHPAYIDVALRKVGFTPKRRLAVSSLRLGLIKSLLPLSAMIALDRLIQPTGGVLPISPSIFVENQVPGVRVPVAPLESMFKCPTCGAANLRRDGDVMICANDHRWAIRDGIYDFKESV
ncbi:MAG: class I SAM-dependent methyltransferase [Anaerolineae bacterium]|nr:class I SAM-dependent methyltransferase [Anaerolineae bacterium]